MLYLNVSSWGRSCGKQFLSVFWRGILSTTSLGYKLFMWLDKFCLGFALVDPKTYLNSLSYFQKLGNGGKGKGHKLGLGLVGRTLPIAVIQSSSTSNPNGSIRYFAAFPFLPQRIRTNGWPYFLGARQERMKGRSQSNSSAALLGRHARICKIILSPMGCWKGRKGTLWSGSQNSRSIS